MLTMESTAHLRAVYRQTPTTLKTTAHAPAPHGLETIARHGAKISGRLISLPVSLIRPRGLISGQSHEDLVLCVPKRKNRLYKRSSAPSEPRQKPGSVCTVRTIARPRHTIAAELGPEACSVFLNGVLICLNYSSQLIL
jgi:hypothetical protein